MFSSTVMSPPDSKRTHRLGQGVHRLGDRAQGEGGVDPVGPTQVRAHRHDGALDHQSLQGGQGGADPEVVTDLAVVSGTLRSDRTSTARPETSTSSRVRYSLNVSLSGGSQLLQDAPQLDGVVLRPV